MNKNGIYACSNCGVSLNNRNDWCDLGCGSDYNEMIDISGRKFIEYSIGDKKRRDEAVAFVSSPKLHRKKRR